MQAVKPHAEHVEVPAVSDVIPVELFAIVTTHAQLHVKVVAGIVQLHVATIVLLVPQIVPAVLHAEVATALAIPDAIVHVQGPVIAAVTQVVILRAPGIVAVVATAAALQHATGAVPVEVVMGHVLRGAIRTVTQVPMPWHE